MNKGGMGVGSASIVLVFAVLCLTVFSLITLVVARNNKALADAEASLVTGYYKADTLAERILAGILEAGAMPDTVNGVEIDISWDMARDADVASYICPISDIKELYVRLAIHEDSVEILNWQMLDIGEWEYDSSLGVWLGEDIFDMLDLDGDDFFNEEQTSGN